MGMLTAFPVTWLRPLPPGTAHFHVTRDAASPKRPA